jgi:hypothetical protein
MSAKKRTSLDAVFATEASPAVTSPKKRRDSNEPGVSAESAGADARTQERGGEPRRPNYKQHTAYLPLAVHEQLRKLAFEENSKMHDYLVEGLDRVFADRGLPTVKELSRHAYTRI